MTTKKISKVLTIAGSDSSGGAGIQADIKTISAHGGYAMSAITALTAQNTTGVYGVEAVTPEFVGQQLDCIFKDIPPDAVKIGMVSSSAIIKVISDKLKAYKAENIVVDPVMVATSGSALISEEAMATLIEDLLPLGAVITPNIPEAEKLCGFAITSEEAMVEAAKVIGADIKGSVLIKGGHFGDNANDLLYSDGKAVWVRGPRLSNPNTHGTGCTLSSAIAVNLADGCTVEESVKKAKAYITGAIEAGLDLGQGRGPLNHMYPLK